MSREGAEDAAWESSQRWRQPCGRQWHHHSLAPSLVSVRWCKQDKTSIASDDVLPGEACRPSLPPAHLVRAPPPVHCELAQAGGQAAGRQANGVGCGEVGNSRRSAAAGCKRPR